MTQPSPSSSTAPAAAPDDPTSLAPGFRFHPTDEELVSYYLKRKVLGRALKVDAIAEVDLYKLEPWDLPARSRLRSRDSQWYFFSRLDRKHANRARTNRATAGGYWKTTGKDREVRHGARIVGMKKTLVFHAGRAPKGERTNWVMHEYRLEGDGAAGIPQDSFVVCRIFQKAGPGPQNGAQYGAPFVEEEWEADEDDDGSLLPVERDAVVEHEAPGAMEKGYLQMTDLIQDLAGHNENGGVALPVSDTSNNSNQSEDVEGNSGDILNDPNIGSNFLQYVHPAGQNNLTVNENMFSNANGGEFLNSSTPSDEFLELKDLEFPLDNGSTIWPSDAWAWKTPYASDAVNGANNEVLPIMGEQPFQPDELAQLLQTLQDDSSPLGSTITDLPHSSVTNSFKPEDDLLFFDAPFDSTMLSDAFTQPNRFLSSPATNLSGMDMVDDGMPYYDAVEDNLFNDMMCSVHQSAGSSSHVFKGPVLTQEVNNTTYTYGPTQKVLEPNFVVGTPSATRLPEAGSQLNCVALPDSQPKNSSIGKRFVRMLDSISAPPAFAAEFPANLRNTVSFSTEVIISRQDKWSVQKDEGVELLFSTAIQPNNRIHCGGCNTVTAVLRGGFCLFFFLSAIMLLVSYEVGLCFDSPLGSPGAADCGSCVASMLELSRLIIESGWVPPRPVIFLFNGAEELFLLGSHGFIKTHKWNSTIGAFINIEASGSGGADLVCQSGPGSWPSRIYAQNAKYPMANSVAQDMFGIIPGDTDYRIFAEDIANIPGLDIIFVLGGYFYHTSYDTLENLIPGSIQARGENLFNLIKAFTNSSMLLKESERYNKAVNDKINNPRAIFFDYMTWFMIFYPRDVSLILHSLPVAVFLLTPLFLNIPKITMMSMFQTILDLARGMLLHAFGVILAIIIPAMAAGLRLLFTKNAMNWFAHPYSAFFMFVPASLVGLLLPRFIWVLSEQSHFWGAFGLYSLITLAYMLAGLSGGFLTFFISMSLLLGSFISSISRKLLSQQQSPRSLFGYVLPMIPCLLYCVYYGGFLIQFSIEKMGMMGSLPKPLGYFVPDIIVAAMVGLVVGWSFGPLIPITSRWLAKTSILQCLLQITVVAMAISSQLFPYSTGAPKRVVLQHTFVTDSNNIVESNYGFSVVDANSLEFVFNNAPEAAKWLKDNSELSLKEKYWSDRSSWVALYPVPFLFSGSLKFPAQTEEIRKHYQHFPRLVVQKTLSNNWTRRVHLELSLGSLSEIWTTSLNITGPLSNWSFADNMLPAPQTVSGGPPSYICRLTGQSNENWSFWLEANSSEPLRIDVAVLDQFLVDSTKELKSLFPSWADMTVFTTFFSTYHFHL